MIEPLLDVDLSREGDRFQAREVISAVLALVPRAHARGVQNTFEGTAVCWGPYQTFRQMVEEDPRCSTRNPLFSARAARDRQLLGAWISAAVFGRGACSTPASPDPG